MEIITAVELRETDAFEQVSGIGKRSAETKNRKKKDKDQFMN